MPCLCDLHLDTGQSLGPIKIAIAPHFFHIPNLPLVPAAECCHPDPSRGQKALIWIPNAMCVVPLGPPGPKGPLETGGSYMRYLIAETSWNMMSLAQEILGTGTLLTRTDRPEDLFHYLTVGSADLLLIEADQLNRSNVTLRGLRSAAGQMPIVLLAADATSLQRAEWLADGADAIVDPASSPAEICCHLMAIARRALGYPIPVLNFGPLRLSLDKRIAHISDCPVKLSPKIYEMLEYIALRPGQLIAREALMTHLYGLDNEPETRIFDVYACNIRSCLKATQGIVELETVRGVGFRLTLTEIPAPVAA